MTLKMGLIGSGIAKSRMPRLQMHLARLSGIAADYILIDGAGIDGFDPVAEVKRRKAEGFNGVNVTHPYKQRVWDVVDQPLVPMHGAIGSYNTLKFADGRILGANTDFSGFIRGFRYRLGDQSPGVTVLCGAGGVGRAVAFALAQLGVAELRIFDLNREQANSLRDALAAAGVNATVVAETGLVDAMKDADGLVNCTALGMYNHPGTAFPAEAIAGQKWAFDAVYTPLKTEFLQRCEAQGVFCMSGFDLWIFQGLDAFRIFTGVTVEADEALLSTALSWLD